MPSVGEVYKNCLNKIEDTGLFSGDLRLLIMSHMGYSSQIEVITNSNVEFKDFAGFSLKFEEFLQGKPVEYIVKNSSFLNYDIYVDERVLIPRMETQELIANLSERIYEYFDPRNYLVAADICTGSGCISIALKGLFKNWLITASDISQDALDVAKINFDRYGYPIRVLKGDGLDPFIEANMALDVIVCNPPYIRNKERVQDSVKRYEPELALYLDETHSVYENIFSKYKKVKKGSLLMCFEIDDDIVGYLKDLMDRYLENYTFEFIKDLNGFDRFLFIFME